ncbi:MAG: hypothetical protein KBG28_08200 [Kofleriaceae bacterium]|jgi:hypothetical protein|nr:hypothetical protein [Kofleriaceae bacterium]MBP6842010.1 hypothetical protein [Kofleriaceae bacterium]MBP9203926.1 hypothetical protein [Kofleriaceae bacterium]
MSKLTLVMAVAFGLLAPAGSAGAQVVKLKPTSAAPAKKKPAPAPRRKAPARPKKKKPTPAARRPEVKLVPDDDEPVARTSRDDGGVRVKLSFRDADD